MSRMTRLFLVAYGCQLIFGIWTASACSVAFYTGNEGEDNERRLIGRTADLVPGTFDIDYHLTVYPRGIERNGNTADESLANPARWTSKYGSIVVYDFVEGFNEKGLFVHPLYLDKSVYPEPDESTPCVSIMKLTSYLLDNAATVSECLELLDEVLVVSEQFQGYPLPMHWAIRDAANDMAIIEFVNGGTRRRPKSKRVIYRGKEYDVLTNEPYLSKQLKYHRRFSRKTRALPGDFNGMARFVRLKVFMSTLPPGNNDWEYVTNMFSLMSTVHCIPGVADYSGREPRDEKQWPTIWTTVTDMDNLRLYMRITKYPNTIWVDLKKIDFDTLSKTGRLDPRSFDLAGEANGEIVWE